jgi:hypothetical protein
LKQGLTEDERHTVADQTVALLKERGDPRRPKRVNSSKADADDPTLIEPVELAAA